MRRIAIAQTCPVMGDVAANSAEHLALIGLAVAEGAEIVLFPELSLTGYEPGMAELLAFTETDARLRPLVDAAVAGGVHVIVGAPLRIGPALHIGAFILGPSGSVALYTKRRLGAFGESASCDGTIPPAESTVFTPGDRDPLVEYGSGRAAIAVCADIGDTAHARRARARGADTYLASMFVIPAEFDGDAAKLATYARDHAMVVAMANFGGPSGGLAAAGRSAIWTETGRLVAQLHAGGAGVAVATESRTGWHAREVMLAAGAVDA
jgi:predicted amidohydrolase